MARKDTIDAAELAKKKAAYERQKSRSRKYQSDMSAAGRDIGKIPDVSNPARRESCRTDLLKFCLTYFPKTFTKPVSLNHPKICKIMQYAAIHGGAYAWCDHRGGAKTTFCECFEIWALLYGHLTYIIHCGATKEAAVDSFASVKFELESNPILREDFPEVCYPVERLEGKPQRAAGMISDGRPVRFVWRDSVLVLPTVEGSVSSGSIFKAMGYGGRLRGQKYKTFDGHNRRPDGVVVDDIQKDLNARNPQDATKKIDILQKAVSGMREKGHKFCVLVPGTRLFDHCFMTQITDRKKYPEYQGRTFRAMESLPKNLTLWQEYYKTWIAAAGAFWELDPDDEDAWAKGKMAATDFYREHRAAMDEGAVVAWPDMHEDNELSGVQNVMGVYLKSESTFWSEYQNEPRGGASDGTKVTEEILESKVAMDIPRGIVPAGTSRLTCGMDIQKELIYWLVTAWRKDFEGHIVAYGTYPHQTLAVYGADNPPVKLSEVYPRYDFEGRISAAINCVIDEVLNFEWETEAGGVMTIDRALIDANWEETRDTVFAVINRRYRHFAKNGRYEAYPLLPARGRGTSGRRGFLYSAKDSMESQTKYSFLQRPQSEQELCSTVWINTNKTKSFAAARLCKVVGEPGTITIHAAGVGGHALLFDHLTAEYATPASIGDLKYDKWQVKPNRYDNHWFDCLCHCVVANAMEGDKLRTNDLPQAKAVYTIEEGIG